MEEDERTGETEEVRPDTASEKGPEALPVQSPPPRSSGDRGHPAKKKARRGPKPKKDALDLPVCGHDWCIGEVLKAAGVEGGVCWPRALPWALRGNLAHLPGWGRHCKRWRAEEEYFAVAPGSEAEDVARYKKEAEDLRRLWSYLGPGIVSTKRPRYDGDEPGVVCGCTDGYCKRLEENDQ